MDRIFTPYLHFLPNPFYLPLLIYRTLQPQTNHLWVCVCIFHVYGINYRIKSISLYSISDVLSYYLSIYFCIIILTRWTLSHYYRLCIYYTSVHLSCLFFLENSKGDNSEKLNLLPIKKYLTPMKELICHWRKISYTHPCFIISASIGYYLFMVKVFISVKPKIVTRI